jgi:hypothetical protein
MGWEKLRVSIEGNKQEQRGLEKINCNAGAQEIDRRIVAVGVDRANTCESEVR